MSDKGIVISLDQAVGASASVLACSEIQNDKVTVKRIITVRSKREAEGWVELLAVGIDRNRILFV